MSLYVGNRKLKNLYVGNRKVAAAYVGDRLVYSAAPVSADINSTEKPASKSGRGSKNVSGSDEE